MRYHRNMNKIIRIPGHTSPFRGIGDFPTLCEWRKPIASASVLAKKPAENLRSHGNREQHASHRPGEMGLMGDPS